MESESYQELSAASLRWQLSTAIPISAIIAVATSRPREQKPNSFEQQHVYYIVCRGHTRIQLRVDKKLLHDIVTRRLGVAEW